MFEKTRDLIQERLLENSLPSLSVAVAHRGEVIWEEAFGLADRERLAPATPDTLYSLASISKPMTATGLMVLVERGLIDLDTPINTYLGDTPLVGRLAGPSAATVRSVANHSSGLPMHFQFFYADEQRQRPAMSETIRRYGNLVTEPGERYQYSNLGYGVLDYLIERVSGKRFADFMREEVFLPLGMFHTSVDIGPGLEPYAATRYASDGTPYPFYTFDHPGASAMFSSARDLLRFGLFHIGHPQPGQKAILKPESLAEMQRITMYAQPGRGAGVGWRMLEDDMGYRSVGHDGGMGGVQTLLRMLPETGSVAVALCNSSKPSPPVPYGLAEELFSGLLPDYAERYEQRKREGFVAGSQVPPATPPGDLPAKLTGTWRGSVSTMAGERPFTLWVKGCGDIIAEYNGQLRSLVNNVGYQNGQLTGDFLGNIDTPDWEGLPHQLRIDMRWRGGDRLNGAILAMSPLHDSGLPGRRIGHCLNHWVDLERVEE